VRWSNLTLDADEQHRLPGYGDAAVVRRFDAPEALDIRFYEVRARSMLNRVPERSQMPFRWTVNPYRGCTHACTYCFARPTHTFLDFDAGRDFEREIVVKVNAPERLAADLARPRWSRQHVALGTNTDPYQWVESRYKLMPGIWRALLEARTPCSVLTKSPLLLRDLDLFRALAAGPGFTASLSVPTLEEKAWRASEPHTPNPRARLEAVAELNRAGIPTGVLVAPLMPGINDDPGQVEKILELAAEAGATSIGGLALHLRGEVRGVFMDWLRSYRPDLVERYERLYARGAYAPRAERRRLAALASDGVRSWREIQSGEGPDGAFEGEPEPRATAREAPAAPGPGGRPRPGRPDCMQEALFGRL
jgi:DNA repair photolyase